MIGQPSTRIFTLVITAAGALMTSGVAWATPKLQLYLEGAEYNVERETWELAPQGSSADEPFNLWTIGRTKYGNQPVSPIYDARIAIAYDKSWGPDLVFDLTPYTTNGLGGFVDDPSLVHQPIHLQTVTDGSTPVLSDGKPLAPHGVYGSNTIWQEFYLGHFGAAEKLDADNNMVPFAKPLAKHDPVSPIEDFVGEFPQLGNKPKLTGQINVYQIRVRKLNDDGILEPFHGVELFIDLYNHTESPTKAWFAPFSHNARVVPSPTAGMAAMLLVSMLGLRRRRPTAGEQVI
jgi:hypothetical protein